MKHELLFTSRFHRAFKKVDRKTQKELIDELEQLANDPFRHPHLRKIQGISQPGYRLRIGRWRLLCLLITKDQTIEVLDLFLKTGSSDYRRRMYLFD